MTVATEYAVWSPVRVEDELLLSCLRAALGARNVARVRSLVTGPLDWSSVLRAARRHRVTALMHTTLASICPEAVPPAIRDELEAEFQRNTRHSVAFAAELLKLSAELEGRGIPVVPFKGPVLAATAYGHLGVREFGDLDLLVRKADVARASEILENRGFRPQFDLGARQAAFIEERCEHAFSRVTDGLVVDLHWAIVPTHFSFSLDPKAFWQRLRHTMLAGREVRVLAPEDLVIALCLHGAKHSWEQLNWVCDLAQAIRASPDLRWAVITEGNGGGSRMVLLGLRLLQTLLAFDLPDAVARRLEGRRDVRRLADRITALMLHDPTQGVSSIARDLLYLRSMERLRDRIRYCADQVVVPSPLDWSWMPMPSLVSSVYYVIRPTRLALKYGRKFVRRVTVQRTWGRRPS